jgi:hypothetical protein
MAGPNPFRCDACAFSLLLVRTRPDVNTELRAREMEAALGSGLPKGAATRLTDTIPEKC